MKNYFCIEPKCLARVSEKGEMCDDCKNAKELEEQYEEGEYDFK